ncbi:proteasome maturation protein [Thrips palmi]|uniref:Proteasome maturation protein n=1 Tax=Thrips palmi TaxID=161013 RepID=A0A6P9A023_THRPL|nr:proteasome maturation protein [Thrips palmi]
MSFGFSGKMGVSSGRSDNSVGFYGVPDVMTSGLTTRKALTIPAHPLEATERSFHDNKLRMEMNMLRNTQGLHAPLKMAMELKAAHKVGRLPFLPSSNLMADVLLGRDDQLSFEDFLNPVEFREEGGQPHAIVEKSLGIL